MTWLAQFLITVIEQSTEIDSLSSETYPDTVTVVEPMFELSIEYQPINLLLSGSGVSHVYDESQSSEYYKVQRGSSVVNSGTSKET